MSVSDAVSIDRISRIVGYKLTSGDFSLVSPNLPQRIAIVGQVNTAQQGTVTPNVGTVITTAKQAGDLYGYGSPLHMAMRILKPVHSDGVGGIPVIAFPQLEGAGGTAKEIEITVTGTATANGLQSVNIAGRVAIDGNNYNFSVVTGDTATVVAQSISDAINLVLESPFIATSAIGVVTLISKWSDGNAADLKASIDDLELSLGLTYVVATSVPAVGLATITDSLTTFGEDWNTIVVNTYSIDQTSILDELEAFNGVPSATTPTGRYQGVIMRPFIALVGAIDTTADWSGRKLQVTNAVCLADLSEGMPLEAAANMAVLFAVTAQNTPHLDVGGQSYPDMPTSTALSTMRDYPARDALMKTGISTTFVVDGAYQVQDFITSYRPDGEAVPQFRYARNLMLDFNVRFGYFLLEQAFVVDHVIAKDNDVVSAAKVVKPKQWKGVVDKYASDLVLRALIVDASFMQNSILVALSVSNPDRLETFFRYKRSGVVRIASTTAEAGFNFG